MGKKKSNTVSMQTIADAVGVARSTVSFALNGKEKDGRISKEMAPKDTDGSQRHELSGE